MGLSSTCASVYQLRSVEPGETIPEELADPKALKDLRYLLIYASTQDSRPDGLRRWSCAILRVMHVLAHVDNDLFTSYSRQIQEQILRPFHDFVFDDPASGVQLGAQGDIERIPLKKFEIKSFKTSDSSILKLLAKREAIAFGILDKVGVRFITKTVYDVFRVMSFLVEKSIVSFPHVVTGQANNTIYPASMFGEVMNALPKDRTLSAEEIDQLLQQKLANEKSTAEFIEKPNDFSSQNYRFIKFISRRLIRIQECEKALSFFYPYEVQLMDYETHVQNLSGASAHDEYKNRQRQAARERVLGVSE